MVRVVHLKDVNYTFPARNIHTFVLGVVIEIIGVFGAGQRRNQLA
jgi:hypothetical protein